jgi:hypothetical protein
LRELRFSLLEKLASEMRFGLYAQRIRLSIIWILFLPKLGRLWPEKRNWIIKGFPERKHR